jgi:hypothetical protein
MKRLRNLIICFAILSTFIGCAVQKDYVAADKLFYEAIAPEYLQFVDANPNFDNDQKERRKRTVAAWKLMIDKWSK